ncbi:MULTISPECIES: alanine/glycine:cation symporter family protein [Vitreoscilla]|uniref:Alanine:cation symporter family protein n=1 Tax=Vitreoscilla stercoraria TaxID=61 RepID=A0ABY4E878_VITST|nr:MULTISPECIES: alanine/glycine:cation symporter family protein [Vitreoscilla]AUZ04660.2 amino-acid carrier protein [Vitreoscilla sp. C1]UOO91649.1 alanine:cation symporter family protein [Vitreoscilla stercoraria]
MQAIVDFLNGLIWSLPLIYGCLLIGLYFSIRTRFAQVRHFFGMLRLMMDGKSSDAGVSSFQALTMALAGRVGTGNIAGVAAAITFGGPGALFWMWAVAFLGASTAYIESALAQIYKERHDGQFRGGPAFYIEKGFKNKGFGKIYAIIFAFSAILACGVLLPGIQANSIAGAINNAIGVDTAVTAAILAVILGFIIFGGVKRIAKFAEIVVPFMALAYIIIALVIVIMNIGELPNVLALIFKSAFGAEAAFGAVLGLAVEWGVKRGVYSNEAGQGTGPHPAGAANVSHPAKQGLVQAFSVYVDTLLVCSATGFMLIITGMYNTQDPVNEGVFLHHGVPGVTGAGYTQTAMESVLPGFGSLFVAFALLFFAFTTIIAYYYIAETNISYLVKNNAKLRSLLMQVLKLAMIVMVVFGCIKSADLAWALGDVGVGLMAWLNLIAILILQKPAIAALKDYERQKAQGKDPIYVPEENGVDNAPIWKEIGEEFRNKQ